MTEDRKSKPALILSSVISLPSSGRGAPAKKCWRSLGKSADCGGRTEDLGGDPMLKPIVAPLAGALLAATLLVTGARAQDDRCVGGQTPGGVIIVLFDRGQSFLNARAQRELATITRQAIAQKA